MLKLTRRSMLVGTSALAAAAALPARAFAAARTYHALLVACTQYPNLPPKVTLIGPKHDAVLVHEYLLKNTPPQVIFAPQNVTVLATEVEGATGAPTHENIKAAFAALAAKVQRDDFVYLHLSGHGAQQPAMNAGDETDGLDEIFLPSDTNRWQDQSKGVPNALIDNEIGAALDAIRDKGAFVWVIFDCCHSGTATRAVSDEMERQVEFKDLVHDGIAEEEADRIIAAATGASASRGFDEAGNRKPAFNLVNPTSAASIAKGGMVAFFAAQTIETTPEMPLPKGAEDAQRYGLFTYTIFSKLAENPNITYRQLGHAVLQQYSADARPRPTPLFEGELDARIFGSTAIDTIMQWPIDIKDGAATLPAGLLHRLARGAKLAILPSPTSELDEALGYLEVKSAKNLTSTVAPVAYEAGGKPYPAVALDQLPPKPYARLAEVVVDYRLTVARPAEAPGLTAEVALVNAALDDLSARTDATFSIALVAPGAQADLRLAVLRESEIKGARAGAPATPALWFLPPSGDIALDNGKRPPLVAIDLADRPKLETGVSGNLTKIFRATGLSRLATASDYPADQVSVAFTIKRVKTDTVEPLGGATVPRVNPGDEVHIKAENLSSKLVDINILYVGSDYSITHIDAQRLVSGAKVEEGLLAFTDASFGMERMIAVLTEAPAQSEIEDLSFLAQEGVPPETRAVGVRGGFSAMLTDIGAAPSTRSAMKLGDKAGAAKGAVMIFPLETVPAS